MKWVAAALGVMIAPAIARATECAGPPWDPWPWQIDASFPADGFPVDAHPWIFATCGTTTQGCSLVADDHSLAVSLLADDAPCEEHPFARFVLELVPGEALRPSHTYRLECEALLVDEDGFSEGEEGEVVEVRTRADETPSAAPGEVEVGRVRMVRSDATFCGCESGDAFGLSLGELADAYLRDGGRIEATYPEGQVHVITAATERLAGEVRLPFADEPIALTPVAADGTRGQAVTIEPGEVEDQAVYIPCRASLSGSSRGLWLLAPMVWISARRRRGR